MPHALALGRTGSDLALGRAVPHALAAGGTGSDLAPVRASRSGRRPYRKRSGPRPFGERSGRALARGRAAGFPTLGRWKSPSDAVQGLLVGADCKLFQELLAPHLHVLYLLIGGPRVVVKA